ncbi:MAG: fumarate hydratase [Clostridia bacterium]
MRILSSNTIIHAVKELCIRTATCLSNEIIDSYETAYGNETDQSGREVLRQIMENATIAREDGIPACQDTGMAIFFVEMGNRLVIEDGLLQDAINEGVRQGYREGYLRKSIVSDPFRRVNTGDNTPAVIYTDFVEGDTLRLRLMQKGFGSENMSRIYMLTPSDGKEGVIRAVLETVSEAGPNPCPPLYIGIGIGGTMEMAGILSKKALFRNPGQRNPDPEYGKLEEFLLGEINRLGIGPGGYGGSCTAFDVFIETYPTHIAGLPVGITLCCHSLRHGEVVL